MAVRLGLRGRISRLHQSGVSSVLVRCLKTRYHSEWLDSVAPQEPSGACLPQRAPLHTVPSEIHEDPKNAVESLSDRTVSHYGSSSRAPSAVREGSFHQLSLRRNAHNARHFSPIALANGKRKFMLDTLAVVRQLESHGLSARQSEAVTALLAELMNEHMEEVSQNFISKQAMQMNDMVNENTLSKFKSELLTSQEAQYDTLRRDSERLKAELERARSELKHEVDKLTAGQRLDMSLEKSRIKEELQKEHQETANLTNKLDREINALKAEIEAAKFDVIKYAVGTLVSVSAVGLGLLRLLL